MDNNNHKVWLSNLRKNDKVILVSDSAIYKGNPKGDLNLYRLSITEEKLNGLFSIPYSYITSIENQEKVNYIKIYYGNDLEEELNITDNELKKEIFDYIKNQLPDFKYSKKLPNEFKYVKEPAFAIISIVIFFVWTMYYSVQLNNGVEYELTGGRPGLESIIFSIANLGYLKVVIIYLVLLTVAFIALLKRISTRSETEYLDRHV